MISEADKLFLPAGFFFLPLFPPPKEAIRFATCDFLFFLVPVTITRRKTPTLSVMNVGKLSLTVGYTSRAFSTSEVQQRDSLKIEGNVLKARARAKVSEGKRRWAELRGHGLFLFARSQRGKRQRVLNVAMKK